MNPDTQQPAASVLEIDNVTKSTLQYVQKHYLVYIIGIIVVALGLTYYLSAFNNIPIMILSVVMPIAIFYGIADSKVQREFTEQFGQSIGYAFTDRADLSTVSGRIFDIGNSRRIFNVLTGVRQGTPNRIFNYQYTVGSGKSRHTDTYTFFEATFANNMPDILLSSRDNFFGSSILGWGEGESVKLEGDFNSYFDLRVPKGFETDAYEIFTPDVMANLIDKAKGLNFEFNGDHLYIYKHEEVSTREKMQELFTLADYLIGIFKRSSEAVKIGS